MTKQTLIIEQQHLKEVTAKLGAVIKGSKVLPILDYVHLSVKKSKAVFTGTDLSVTIQCTVQVTCEDAFDCLIPFSPLKSVASIAAGTIAIVKEEKSLKIVHANDELRLGMEVVGDYPKVPQVTKKVKVSFDESFTEGIKQAVLSVGKDALRESMTNVCLDFSSEGVNIVSTDAHSLFLQTIKQETEISEQLLVPATACNSITGKVALSFSDKHVQFESEGMTVIARRSDVKYPDYKRVLQKPDFNLTVSRSELFNALQLCALTDTATRMTVFQLEATQFTLKADFQETSNYAKTTITTPYTGSANEIAVNGDLMLRSLKQLGTCEELELSIISPSKVITMQRKGDDSVQCFVMPIAINK